MTKIFFVSVFLINSIALADFLPVLGDFAIYESKRDNRVWVKEKIIAEANIESGAYRIEDYLLRDNGGRTLADQRLMFLDEIKAYEYIEDLEEFCDRVNGEIQVISIKLGSFRSCKWGYKGDYRSTTIWSVEGVPFADIRIIVDKVNGSEIDRIESELVSFGNKHKIRSL